MPFVNLREKLLNLISPYESKQIRPNTFFDFLGTSGIIQGEVKNEQCILVFLECLNRSINQSLTRNFMAINDECYGKTAGLRRLYKVMEWY